MRPQSEQRNAQDGTPSHGPFSFDDYDNVIGFVVSQTGYQLSQTLARAIGGLGSDIRPREFAVLNRLHQYGALTQTQLAQLTYRDKPAMTRMLDRLAARNLVTKVAAQGDRRAFMVSLTPRGEALRDAIVPLIVAMLEHACRNISAKDLATTVATLRQIGSQLGD